MAVLQSTKLPLESFLKGYINKHKIIGLCFWQSLPACCPLLHLFYGESSVPHVEVCDHSLAPILASLLKVVGAAKEVDTHKEVEGDLEVLKIFIHVIIDIE